MARAAPDSATHHELREALGLLAMDKLDGDERRAVRAHVDTCAGCRRELDDFGRIIDLLGQVDSPGLDARLSR